VVISTKHTTLRIVNLVSNMCKECV